MIKHPDLHRIQIGRAKPEEARRALRQCLQSDDPTMPVHVYTALRGWTWKALNSRWLDEGLHDWFAIMRSVESVAGRSHPQLALQISVLSDLVQESIRIAERSTQENLLRREHLGEILEAIRRNNGPIRRKQLAEEFDLHDTHLTQLMNELEARGKVDAVKYGREKEYSLTETGRELADAWSDARRQLANAPHDDFVRSEAKVQTEEYAVRYEVAIKGASGDEPNLEVFGLEEVETPSRGQTLKMAAYKTKEKPVAEGGKKLTALSAAKVAVREMDLIGVVNGRKLPGHKGAELEDEIVGPPRFLSQRSDLREFESYEGR